MVNSKQPHRVSHANNNLNANLVSSGILGAESNPTGESDDLFNKLIINLNSNSNLQNESIKEKFKLHLIKDEEDLHNYKNLLNAMAALFYTNHKMNDVQEGFKQWLQLSKARGLSKREASRAVPAIQIDTELANAQYEHQEMQQLEIGDHLQPSPEIANTGQQETANNMIKIAGEEAIPEYIDNKEVSPQSDNNDAQQTDQNED